MNYLHIEFAPQKVNFVLEVYILKSMEHEYPLYNKYELKFEEHVSHMRKAELFPVKCTGVFGDEYIFIILKEIDGPYNKFSIINLPKDSLINLTFNTKTYRNMPSDKATHFLIMNILPFKYLTLTLDRLPNKKSKLYKINFPTIINLNKLFGQPQIDDHGAAGEHFWDVTINNEFGNLTPDMFTYKIDKL